MQQRHIHPNKSPPFRTQVNKGVVKDYPIKRQGLVPVSLSERVGQFDDHF